MGTAQGKQNASECPTNTLQNSSAAHGVPSGRHAVCPGHVSSIFPIACADEKRSATAQMIVFMLAGLRGNSLSGGGRGRRRREHGAPLVFAVCVYYRNVAARRPPRHRIPVAATSQFSLSESRPRGPCGGCPPRATSSPRRVAAGRFMLAQTIVTLLRQQGDARHRRSRPQCWRYCKV